MEVQCPVCKQLHEWKNNPTRPFCSPSCKQRDLGNWADERYRVPMHEVEDILFLEDDPTKGKKSSDPDEN